MNLKLFGIIFVLYFVGTFARSYRFLIKEDSSPEDILPSNDSKSSELNRSRRSIKSQVVDMDVNLLLPAVKISRPFLLPTKPAKPFQVTKPSRVTRPTMPNRTTQQPKPSRIPRTIMQRLLKASSTTIV